MNTNLDLVNRSLGAESSERAGENILTLYGQLDESKRHTDVYLPNGRVVRVPTGILLQALDSHVPEGEQDDSSPASHTDDGQPARPQAERLVIPVIEETLQVGKRTVPTKRVLLQKHVHEYEEALDVPLAVRTFDIERVVFNQEVETAPPVRHEGDTTIYPLVEERLVLTKQLILKEEVRVTKRDTERRDTRTVTLRRETLSVTHAPADALETPGADK